MLELSQQLANFLNMAELFSPEDISFEQIVEVYKEIGRVAIAEQDTASSDFS